MTSGYDRRSRLTDKVSCRTYDRFGGVEQSVVGWRKSEETVSFRDEVSGTRLDPQEVDPYFGFVEASDDLSAYLNAGPHFLAELEASGLATEADYRSLSEGNAVFDNGHPFSTVKREIYFGPSKRSVFTFANSAPSTNRKMAEGMCVETLRLKSGADEPMWDITPAGFSDVRYVAGHRIPVPSTSDLASFGTKMIAKVSPGKPEASLSAAVGELILGLPLLPGLALLKSPSTAMLGSEYLNVVFGILPTLSDAKHFGGILKNLSLKVHQLRRDEGRPVRRRMTLPIEVSQQTYGDSDIVTGTGRVARAVGGTQLLFDKMLVSGYGSSTAQSVASGISSNASLSLSQSRELSFSGSFTYYIPLIPGFSNRVGKYVSEYDRLLGLQGDSAAAWQLTPWSWLVDWFHDVSSQIAAIEVAHDDNLVINYGYAMESLTRELYANIQLAPTGLYASPNSAHTRERLRMKTRIRANPYGFISPTDDTEWSAYRLAILSALGLSRR